MDPYVIPLLVYALFLVGLFLYFKRPDNTSGFRTLQSKWDVSTIAPVVTGLDTLNYGGKVVIISGISANKSSPHTAQAIGYMRALLREGRSELTQIVEIADDTCKAKVHIVGVGDLSIKLLKAGYVTASYGASNQQIEAEKYAKVRELGIWGPSPVLPETQPATDAKNFEPNSLEEQSRIWASYGKVAIQDAQIHRMKQTLDEIEQFAREGRLDEIVELLDTLPDIDLDQDIAYMSQHYVAHGTA